MMVDFSLVHPWTQGKLCMLLNEQCYFSIHIFTHHNEGTRRKKEKKEFDDDDNKNRSGSDNNEDVDDDYESSLMYEWVRAFVWLDSVGWAKLNKKNTSFEACIRFSHWRIQTRHMQNLILIIYGSYPFFVTNIAPPPSPSSSSSSSFILITIIIVMIVVSVGVVIKILFFVQMF